MAEKQPKRSSTPEPFTKDDYEAMYWGLVDFLTMSMMTDEGRRARLKTLVSRLSEHVRHIELVRRTSSGIRKVHLPDRRDLLRQKLLARRHADEHGNWAIYGEGLPEEGPLILLSIVEGTYAEAVEAALTEPGFITEGMGGQIDLLGMTKKK